MKCNNYINFYKGETHKSFSLVNTFLSRAHMYVCSEKLFARVLASHYGDPVSIQSRDL